MLCMTLILASTSSAQKNDYIIKEIKGNVEYRLKQTNEWKTAKRLLSIPISSQIRISDDGAMIIYSRSNPQIIKISTAGEHNLRYLLNEAKKKTSRSRGGELVHVFSGLSKQELTLRSATSYRGPADISDLSHIAAAVRTATASAPISLTLTKDSVGDYRVALSNDSDAPLAFAVIVNVEGKYSALSISNDSISEHILILPAGAALTVPDCTLADIGGMQAVAVATNVIFDPKTLCIMLNSPANKENNDGTDISAVAVKASLR